jgi:hypothetical protein
MSVSLVSEPDRYCPAYNPIQWVFSSTNVNECDFQFICDIYVNGDFAVRLREFPQGANNYGYFNIERTLQDYLSFNFNANITDFTINPNCVLNYYVEIRERYNISSDCNGATTLSSVQYTGAEKIVWNGAFQYHSFKSFTQSKYVLVNRASKFLTQFKNRQNVLIDDYSVLGFIQATSTDRVYKMQLETFDDQNNLIQTLQLSSQYSSVSSPEIQGDYLLTVGVGPENLNNTIFDGSPTPPQPVIDSNVAWYRITMLDSADDPISEPKEYEIDSRCYKFRMFRLWWFNTLGVFDSFNFNLRSIRKTDVSRTQLTKLLPVPYNIGDRGKSIIGVQADEAYTLNSDFMNEQDAICLEELFTSPEVYMYDNSNITEVHQITGAVYNGGFADLVLNTDVFLEVGTEFTYKVTGISPSIMPNSGSGIITGYDTITGNHTTDITFNTNVGALVTGKLVADIKNNILIPVVVNSNSYEEKIKNNVKSIRYTIEVSPSYSKNIQSL